MREKPSGVPASAERLPACFQAVMSRRQLLTGAALAASGSYFLLHLPRGMAQSAPASDPEVATFLRFSQAITGHQDLDPTTAKKILDAMKRASADFPSQLVRLAELAPGKAEPKALLGSASDAGLRGTALAIVAAWYTGTVESGEQATVVSYADALMYRPVRDGQVVPTYCTYGPAWWTEAPPPIRVSPPVEKPASPPPTTGIPEQKSDTPAAPNSSPQNATPANNRTDKQ